MSVLLPRLAAGGQDCRGLVEIGDAEAQVMERAGAPGRIAGAIEVDGTADRADDLQVRRTRVDERDIDHPLLGGFAVDNDDATE